MKYTKEQWQEMLENKLTFVEMSNITGYSDVYVRKHLIKIGLYKPKLNKRNSTIVKKIRHCKNCNKHIDIYSKDFCSRNCSKEYNRKLKYKDFLENNEKYCRANFCFHFLKDEFLKEQEYKCAICGIENNWNGKELVFVLDHIDGNAANNKRENLRCVCPNCDSQLDTFKSKNKNSARKERYLLNYKNI